MPPTFVLGKSSAKTLVGSGDAVSCKVAVADGVTGMTRPPVEELRGLVTVALVVGTGATTLAVAVAVGDADGVRVAVTVGATVGVTVGA
jgi:hypothetical protein